MSELYNGLGYCNIVDVLGDDWTPVKAARQSYGDTGLKGEEKDIKLLRYLLKNRHSSPFEQASITWEMRMPIFVMRQFVRHRTFRLNEESGRYSEMKDDFYIPKEWRVQNSTGNKQGSYGAIHPELGDIYSRLVSNLCIDAYCLYKDMLAKGFAKEQARIVLPLNLMTSITVNIDLHNLMHFLRLRLDSHAQEEIRVLAQAMSDGFKEKFPIIHGIWQENL